MAQKATTAGQVEGMEAGAQQVAQAASRRYPRGRGPQMVLLAQGLLAISNSTVLPLALPNAYWADFGLKGFLVPYRRFR